MSKAFEELGLDATPLAGAMPAFCVSIPARELRGICEQARARKARLVALWGSDETTRRSGYALHLALGFPSGLLWLSVPLSREDPHYPGIADIYPSANRMQRSTADLLGIIPSADADRRKWLRHGAWPEGAFPLRKTVEAAARFAHGPDRYPFIPVEGEGVHEIPVGPVHAGTIEPGHFRFSIVGEKILRLEERLGYTHKGIEKRFEQMTLEEGAKLASRVSGDSTVAYAWAYAMAVEGATGTEPPPRALALRGILLELERIANHLGDLGYLGNDVALSFGFFQFWRLSERHRARSARRLPEPALGAARSARGFAHARRRRRARCGALRRDLRIDAPRAGARAATTRRGHPRAGRGGRCGRARPGLDRRLARRGDDRAGNRRGEPHPPPPSARSLLAELAPPRAHGARQHRSGLSAHQQVVQPELQRRGFVKCINC